MHRSHTCAFEGFAKPRKMLGAESKDAGSALDTYLHWEKSAVTSHVGFSGAFERRTALCRSSSLVKKVLRADFVLAPI
jgi:hypothetical protein